MKLFTIILLTGIFLLACNKEVEIQIVEDKTANLEEDPNFHELAFMHRVSFESFKSDFRMTDALSRSRRRFKMQSEFKRLVNRPNENFIIENYPEVKEYLIEWDTRPAGDAKLKSIQSIALRCLKNHFLKHNNKRAVEESKFLMNLLVKNEAVDLDVLADGFLHIKNDISPDRQSEYEAYILKVYADGRNQVLDSEKALKSSYDVATDSDKFRLLRQIKNIERLSKSCDYTKKVLGFA